MLKTVIAATVAVAFVACQALAGALVTASSGGGGGASPQWYVMPHGGVGFTNAIYFSSDGTAVARTDTSNAYIKSPGAPGTRKWRPLYTYNSVLNANSASPPGQFIGWDTNRVLQYPQRNSAAAEIAISWSNSQIIIMAMNGYLWKTTNGGAAWNVLTSFQIAACGLGGTFANDCQTSAACTALKAVVPAVPSACQIKMNGSGGGCAALTCPVFDSNGSNHQTGPHFAIDPANPLYMAVIFGTLGLFTTSDGGNTWTNHNGDVGAPTATTTALQMIGGQVCYDPGSSRGGVTPGMYAMIYGVGFFHSTNSGVNWNQLNGENGTGMPTATRQMACGADGINGSRVFVSLQPASQNVSYFTPGTPGAWTTGVNVSAAGQAGLVGSLAFDPNKPERLLAGADGNGHAGVTVTTNAITGNPPTWGGFPAKVAQPGCVGGLGIQKSSGGALGVGDVRWLSVSTPPDCGITGGIGSFDPSITGSGESTFYYLGEGTGNAVMLPTDAQTVSNITFAWYSTNLENSNAQGIVTSANGVIAIVTLDRRLFFWNSQNNANYSGGDSRNLTPAFNPPPTACCIAGNHVAFASQNQSKMLLLAFGNGGNTTTDVTSSISSDDGMTWTTFESLCSATCGANAPWVATNASGGSIASFDGTKIVVIPSNNLSPWESQDGGATWSQPTIPLVPTTGETGWASGRAIHRLCEDGSDFYAYNNGQSGNTSFAGIYASADGVTWSRAHSGLMQSYLNDSALGKMSCVPGKTGDLWYNGRGDLGIGTPINFIHITGCPGACATTIIPNVKSVISHGWGLAKPGGDGYPSLYIIGWVQPGGVGGYKFGIWRSDNADAVPTSNITWTQLVGPDGLSWPFGQYDQVLSLGIDGDKNTWNVCYVVGFGQGAFYWK
jgi:hypothetical protein